MAALQQQKLTFLLGVVFSTKEWWAVDLLAICQVHLVRVVTNLNYKPDELKNLVIKVGEFTTPETALKFSPSMQPLKVGHYRYQSLWDEGRGSLERWQGSLCCKTLHCTLKESIISYAIILGLKKHFLTFSPVIW